MKRRLKSRINQDQESMTFQQARNRFYNHALQPTDQVDRYYCLLLWQKEALKKTEHRLLLSMLPIWWLHTFSFIMSHLLVTPHLMTHRFLSSGNNRTIDPAYWLWALREAAVIVLCRQHVNRLATALANPVTHAMTQALTLLFDLTDGRMKGDRSWLLCWI